MTIPQRPKHCQRSGFAVAFQAVDGLRPGVTPALVGTLVEARILRECRGWGNASDHVPVMVTIGGSG